MNTQNRQTHLDLLKLTASQLIVLHHFAAYGPLSDALLLAAPALVTWLYADARMAVQVFLVIGGYLAAQSFAAPAGTSLGTLVRMLLRRYRRLALPFFAAVLLAVSVAAIIRPWLGSDFIPAAPGWIQIFAHATLSHGVFGHDALSAGVWYVAIDFQLFVLMACLLWIGRRVGVASYLPHALVVGVMLASLFHFNLDAGWDNRAPYFFGAYGMGAVAYWAAQSSYSGRLLAVLAAVGAGAVAIAFRERIVLALSVALLLGVLQKHAASLTLPVRMRSAISALGQASYALFLVHFSVLMLGNALFYGLFQVYFARAGWQQPTAAIGMLLLCLAASTWLAILFLRHVETPLSSWGRRSSAVV